MQSCRKYTVYSAKCDAMTKKKKVIGQIPTDLILVLPYVLTVILLAGFIGKATPPRAIGTPYIKER